MALSPGNEKSAYPLSQSWRIRLRQDGSSARRAVVEAFSHALFAADPERIIRYKVKLEDDVLRIHNLSLKIAEFERVLVIGGGKASARMALELERVLDGKLTGGSLNIPDYTRPWPRGSRISFNPASHPIPSEKGVRGVKKMLKLVERPSRKDLVICLISGGGSALMPLPSKEVRLSDKQKTTRLLLKSGSTIEETNTVRKHLSEFKGGRLAEKLYPAAVVTLIVSDVVGDPLGSIASGPTVADETTFADAYNVLHRRGLWQKVPRSVRKRIQAGRAGRLPETPKRGSSAFKRVHNILLATNRESCIAASQVLEELGYHPMILSTELQGEAKEVGKVLSGIVSGIRDNNTPISPPAAIIAGGETTVTVRGKGRGGRNQELVLSAAQALRGKPKVLVSSIGTDGVDGSTKAAGAVADGETVERGWKKNLDADTFLQRNDSNSFFKKINDLIVTGPTGTNVNDIMIAIVDSEEKHDTGSPPAEA